MHALKELQQTILETSKKLDSIKSPTFLIQGSLDDSLYKESTSIIYQQVKTETKQLKWYEQSGHIITLGEEREQVCEDVCAFLDSLSW
ncbi:esterase/lipase [Oceanobacillus polygoni]|uniref:Esterase/lipase n=1 Tax=Oceanobacillus polygoni TaxID=1235259 RepID=A0A9X0YT79_9BACI|nr:esterase/lipase [Oceanobacillus polygoni]